MPCVCRVNTLALFIRRVALIDLEPSIRNTVKCQPLSLTPRKITTLQSHRPQQTTDVLPTRTTISEILTLGPGEKARERERGHQSFHISASESIQKGGRAAAVFEITPESIEALAAEAQQVTFPARLQAFKFQHNSFHQIINDADQNSKSSYKSLQPTPLSEDRAVRKRVSSFRQSRYSNAATENNGEPAIERELWQIQKAALREKFKDGWNPRKRLSPDALAGIRAIHAQFPEQYTTSVLADKFEVSPEAIRRILKSKWTPKEEEELDRQRRWFSRGKKVWSRYAELGLKPPTRWRKLGIGLEDRPLLGREERPRARTNITIRNAGHAVTVSDEDIRGEGLAARIL